MSASVMKLRPFFCCVKVDYGEIELCYEETVG